MCDYAHDETEVDSSIQAPGMFQRQAQLQAAVCTRIPSVLPLSLVFIAGFIATQINRHLRAEYPAH